MALMLKKDTTTIAMQLRRFSLLILFLTGLMLSGNAYAAGGISISTEISRATIPFEGKDTLTVSLTWAGEPFLYQIDDFPMPSLEKLQILGSSTSVSSSADSTVESGTTTTRTYRYVLQPTDYGTGVIEPLDITAKNRVSNESHELKTGRLTVEIAKPIPVEAKGGNGLGIIILAIALVMIFGASSAVYIRVRRRQRESLNVVVDGHYCEALEAIKKEAVADRKLFYSRVYRLLLNFLEKERSLDVSGKTGEEIVTTVQSIEDENERRQITQWLRQAQKIKYQPESPSPGDVENSYDELYKFFENKQEAHRR
jgi:hypothetical protein